MKKMRTINIDENLKKLESIAEWFDRQTDPSIEEGLKKIEETAILIKESRSRLSSIENRFEEVKKLVESDKS